MENVLDVYKRPYSEQYPVVCMDESSKQPIKETRVPVPISAGQPAKVDYEYARCGICNIFIASEPLRGKRHVEVTQRKTKREWATFVKTIADVLYPDAERITIMDNYNTHTAGSLYETFPPEEARKLCERFEFVHTPKHGSWLNMAEIELNVLMGQCLRRRIDTIDENHREVSAWQKSRNNKNSKINWHFTTKNARIKLKRLYPSIYV